MTRLVLTLLYVLGLVRDCPVCRGRGGRYQYVDGPRLRYVVCWLCRGRA